MESSHKEIRLKVLRLLSFADRVIFDFGLNALVSRADDLALAVELFDPVS